MLLCSFLVYMFSHSLFNGVVVLLKCTPTIGYINLYGVYFSYVLAWWFNTLFF